MRRAVGLIIIGIILFPIIIPISITADDNYKSQILTSGQYGKGYRYNIQGWVYIYIEGESYERGYQYGYLASAEIIDMINRWSVYGNFKVKVMNLFYTKSPERYWNLCKSMTMRRAWKQYPEEYREEIKGIADGINARGGKIFGNDVTFQDIVTLSEMQGCWYALKHFWKQIHPMRSLYYWIKNIFSGITTNEDEGYCSAFIATGDATADGGIVAVHSTQPIYELDERFNFIVDINPIKGNRFIMAGAPPGFIWGLTQYYLNDKGIVIMESTLPQGPWRRRGVPIAVRARKAAQYSDSIDDALDSFLNGNNGLYECEWLIGDSKTGEIASIELALFNTPIKRTYNGFYWSCNIPHNSKVVREINGGVPPAISNFFNNLMKGNDNVFENVASPRAEKFQEVEKEYYGKIDIDVAKEIISTNPLCKNSCDTKITTTKLMKNMGLVTHMGNPNGSQWDPSDKQKNDYDFVTPLPISGWVEIYGLDPSNTEFLKSTDKVNYKEGKSKLLWKYETNDIDNRNILSSIISDDIIYELTSSGEILTIDKEIGKEILRKSVIDDSLGPASEGDLIYVGTDTGLLAVDKAISNVEWKKTIGRVNSKPIVTKDLVIVSSSNNDIYAFDTSSGDEKWTYSFHDAPYISNAEQGKIFIGSGSKCFAFDINCEEITWSYETEGLITAPPRVSENTVYVGAWDGNLYALDLRSGNLKWIFKTGWGIVTTPAVSNSRVFVASNDNNFYAIDEKNGNLEWFFNCKSAIHSNPVVYGQYVFFGSDDGRLYALDKTNGNLAWSFTPGYFIKDDPFNYLTTPILSDPYIEDGVVYISAKGTIYALDAQTYEKAEKNSKDDLFNIIKIFFIIVLLFIAILLISISVRKARMN